MALVYDVWFVREYENREDTELAIGVYASEADAQAAIERLKGKPGFCEYPEGFKICPSELGQTGWQEGFITKWGPPPKDAESEAFDLPAWIDDGPPNRSG